MFRENPEMYGNFVAAQAAAEFATNFANTEAIIHAEEVADLEKELNKLRTEASLWRQRALAAENAKSNDSAVIVALQRQRDAWKKTAAAIADARAPDLGWDTIVKNYRIQYEKTPPRPTP